MNRDKYTNFSFDDIESENFKVFMTNKNDLQRSMSPSFSDKFNTPSNGQIRYYEGTTIEKQDFKISCVAEDVTLNEWRAITEWLSPLKSGKLRFEWNDKYYYMVKISKAPTGTMFIKGTVDKYLGQLYIITFDIEFTTINDWAAYGPYCEQNRNEDINPSIYNNPYYMPQIVFKDTIPVSKRISGQVYCPSAELVTINSVLFVRFQDFLISNEETGVSINSNALKNTDVENITIDENMSRVFPYIITFSSKPKIYLYDKLELKELEIGEKLFYSAVKQINGNNIECRIEYTLYYDGTKYQLECTKYDAMTPLSGDDLDNALKEDNIFGVPENMSLNGDLLTIYNRSDVIGSIKIENSKTVYTHKYGDIEWSETIGSPQSFTFISSPNNYFVFNNSDLKNHSVEVLLRNKNNINVVNCGTYESYPDLFLTGDSTVKDMNSDVLYAFKSDNTNRNIYVKINGRTSFMSYAGKSLYSVKNYVGTRLFLLDSIVNNGQLKIESGRPELLKAYFEYEEDHESNGALSKEVSNSNPVYRKASFKINSKPIYYRNKNKFYVHIFNNSFIKDTNIFNKDEYSTENYSNYIDENSRHLLLDSPTIEYEYDSDCQSWRMILYYVIENGGPCYKKDGVTINYSTVDNNNKNAEISSIVNSNNLIYISLCDYDEFNIESDNYSVGFRTREVI